MNSLFSCASILVTGGAGFIGSHIVQELVRLGTKKIVVLDNLSTGNLENLQNVNNNITFLEGDITNMQTCMQAMKGIDIVFHLAAFISVPDSINHPAQCHEANIIGTLNLLHAAQKHGVKRFLFSSSAAVYGTTDQVCHEQLEPKPESPYGHSKLVGEQLCTHFANNFNVETVVLRYFNVHGSRQNPNGAYAAVVAKFTEQMKNNAVITIFGDGLQTRDFVPVSQVVTANLALAQAPTKLVNGQVFNIASGNSITLLQLIDQLKKEYPAYTLEPTFKPARQGDIKYSLASNARYQEVIAQTGTIPSLP